MAHNFARCSCGHTWRTREDLLNDPQAELVGYQVNFGDLDLGFLLFNCLRCRTTVGVEASACRDLYRGPVFEERATGTDDCPGYCLRVDELGRCPAQCECAYVREILNAIRSRDKGSETRQGGSAHDTV